MNFYIVEAVFADGAKWACEVLADSEDAAVRVIREDPRTRPGIILYTVVERAAAPCVLRWYPHGMHVANKELLHEDNTPRFQYDGEGRRICKA